MKRTIPILVLAALATACTSVGVRTIGNRPVTVTIGYVPGQPCASPTPGGEK